MNQYLELLRTIKEKGTQKPAAREGMPGSLSLFGYQFRHDLQSGFPLLTTKKMFWKGVVAELLWFLRGDTNIKYLVDQGVNIWNEDAYQYYLKKGKEAGYSELLEYEDFIDIIKTGQYMEKWPVWFEGFNSVKYHLGDCGYQYGRVWRNWEGDTIRVHSNMGLPFDFAKVQVDQIAKVIKSLKNTPESRRHIVTAIDPAHDTDLALYWCHAMFQFNCRPLSVEDRWELFQKYEWDTEIMRSQMNSEDEELTRLMNKHNVPKYYLDCQLYQRSADVVLGVPFNIASYALLTHIIAKIVNMIPGEFIHTFGDVHIYDNHMAAVDIQLQRTPLKLPTLYLHPDIDWNKTMEDLPFSAFDGRIVLEDYNPMEAIKAELSTGLKKVI